MTPRTPPEAEERPIQRGWRPYGDPWWGVQGRPGGKGQNRPHPGCPRGAPGGPILRIFGGYLITLPVGTKWDIFAHPAFWHKIGVRRDMAHLTRRGSYGRRPGGTQSGYPGGGIGTGELSASGWDDGEAETRRGIVVSPAPRARLASPGWALTERAGSSGVHGDEGGDVRRPEDQGRATRTPFTWGFT